VFWFSLQLMSVIFIILWGMERENEKDNKKLCCCSFRMSVVLILFEWKLNFITSLKKSSKIKLNENPSSESRIVTHGLMDRHVEANIRFSQVHRYGENFSLSLCLCGICNKAYFVREIRVISSTSFTRFLDSVGAS
jgi:hypothetical protein